MSQNVLEVKAVFVLYLVIVSVPIMENIECLDASGMPPQPCHP